MSKFVTAFSVGLIIAAVTNGVGSAPASAATAKLSKADQDALKQATVSCKAQAKGKKLRLLAQRKFVKSCLVEALKDHPKININVLYPDLDGLPETKVQDHM